MESLDFESFVQQRKEYDAAVARTPAVLKYCTSSSWALAGARHLMHPTGAIIRREGEDWVCLVTKELFDKESAALAFESVWCFCSPFVGPDPKHALDMFQRLFAERPRDIGYFCLGGIGEDSSLLFAIPRAFGKRSQIFRTEGFRICWASLDGGLDAFLSRRSQKFRANLRRIRRGAAEEGYEVECHVDGIHPATFFERVQKVEQLCWKYLNQESPFQMRDNLLFYRDMVEMAAGDGRLRGVFIRRDGSDVAYCFGGVFGEQFKGLLASYSDRHRKHGLGNLAQYETIKLLCEHDPQVKRYDLGMEMPYKHAWAENTTQLYNFTAF